MRLVLCTIVALTVTHKVSVVSYAQTNGPAHRDELYEALTSKTGPEYLQARREFLGEGTEAVHYLEQRKKEAADPIDSLVLDALLARSRDPLRLDQAMEKAFAESHAGPGFFRNPASSRMLPECGARWLLYSLGDDAMPLATELFTRGLTPDWEPWQKEVLILTLGYFGSTRGPHHRLMQVRDPRAGHVLLWIVEHDPNEATMAKAGAALRSFPSQQLLNAVQSALQEAEVGAKREALETAARAMEFGLREFAPQAGATQPATSPSITLPEPVTTSLPFRFALDPGRALSPSEQAEINRLITIAADVEESADRRAQAIYLLGERGAHLDCIQPLRQIVESDPQPEELRVEGIVALSRIPESAVVPILIKALADGDTPSIRTAALHQLVRLNPAGALNYGGTTEKERRELAAKWWLDWWAENQETFVPDPDRIGTILKIP